MEVKFTLRLAVACFKVEMLLSNPDLRLKDWEANYLS
jgi:hypothetical protein